MTWDVPLLPDTGSNDATESVVDCIDSNDDVYDVYYDVHECDDTESPGVANPEAFWAGIGQTTAHLDALESYPLAHSPCPCLRHTMYILECIFS